MKNGQSHGGVSIHLTPPHSALVPSLASEVARKTCAATQDEPEEREPSLRREQLCRAELDTYIVLALAACGAAPTRGAARAVSAGVALVHKAESSSVTEEEDVGGVRDKKHSPQQQTRRIPVTLAAGSKAHATAWATAGQCGSLWHWAAPLHSLAVLEAAVLRMVLATQLASLHDRSTHVTITPHWRWRQSHTHTHTHTHNHLPRTLRCHTPPRHARWALTRPGTTHQAHRWRG